MPACAKCRAGTARQDRLIIYYSGRAITMSWWDEVYNNIGVGRELQTPGRGEERIGAKPFKIIYKEPDLFIILTGKSCLPLEKSCFEVIEEAMNINHYLKLRISSVKDNQPLKDTADKLIRERTGSNLARGNYVCSILNEVGLVRYVMFANKKWIEKNV